MTRTVKLKGFPIRKIGDSYGIFIPPALMSHKLEGGLVVGEKYDFIISRARGDEHEENQA